MEEEIEIIREYFSTKGHSYDVILYMLSTYHNIKMPHRTLRARIEELGLRRPVNVYPNICPGPCSSDKMALLMSLVED